MQQMKKRLTESANTVALRGLMIGLAAVVVLSVSGYGTVIYIQLMSKVFPSGPLLMACYMGAGANVLLMLILLVGKFVWFRPGAHEIASWIVTGVELLVAIMNMILAYQLANGHALSSVVAAWYYLAPISPVFSMVGAIVLIMTSTELRKKHHALEIEERKERAEREFELAMHEAEMEVNYQYLGFVKTNLVEELNAPDRQIEMKNHASVLVTRVLSGISGLSSVPRLSREAAQLPAPGQRGSAFPAPAASPALSSEPASVTGELVADVDASWLARVNERIEQERRARLAQQQAARARVEQQLSGEGDALAQWESLYGGGAGSQEGGDGYLSKKG